MADYNYPTDNKLHVRYTQLSQVSPGSLDRILAEINGQTRVETEDMSFGSERHLSWEIEAKRTGFIPKCFGLDWPVLHIEREFATEIMPGVVLHSRPDVVCGNGILVDYKTVKSKTPEFGGIRNAVDQYRHANKQRQLFVYAFQLGMHGIRIKEAAFLCEVWDANRENILDYEIVRFPIGLMDIAGVLPWLRGKVALLMGALEMEHL